MIHIAVVSDRPDTTDTIEEVCGKFMRDRELDLSFVSYENSYIFLQEVENRKRVFEIVFLDTSVRGRNAVDTAEVLRKVPEAPVMIFLSDTEGYCMDAFRVGALHYLLTPVAEKDVMEALQRGMAAIERNWHKKISFRTAAETMIVDLSTLEAVVSDDHHQIFCLTDGRQMEVRGRIGQIRDQLADCSPFLFLSPCRGILVNCEEVAAVQADRVILKSGRILPAAKRKYSDFKVRLARYLGKEDWDE